MARNAADAADATRPKGGFFSITGPEKFFAHGDKPGPAQSAAFRITIPDIVAHLDDAEKFS